MTNYETLKAMLERAKVTHETGPQVTHDERNVRKEFGHQIRIQRLGGGEAIFQFNNDGELTDVDYESDIPDSRDWD